MTWLSHPLPFYYFTKQETLLDSGQGYSIFFSQCLIFLSGNVVHSRVGRCVRWTWGMVVNILKKLFWKFTRVPIMKCEASIFFYIFPGWFALGYYMTYRTLTHSYLSLSLDNQHSKHIEVPYSTVILSLLSDHYASNGFVSAGLACSTSGCTSSRIGEWLR